MAEIASYSSLIFRDVVLAQAFPQRASSETRSTTSNQKTSTILTRRGLGGIGKFKVKLISPLHPFLTVAYFRALRILEAARNLQKFHMQIIHIARQALHLVIILNESVDKVNGPTQEQAYERVNLEDELMDLETSIPKWEGSQFQSKDDFISSAAEIKQQQETFKLMQRRLGLFDEDDGGLTQTPQSIQSSQTMSSHKAKSSRKPAARPEIERFPSHPQEDYASRIFRKDFDSGQVTGPSDN